jgi:hypothetical protein
VHSWKRHIHEDQSRSLAVLAKTLNPLQGLFAGVYDFKQDRRIDLLKDTTDADRVDLLSSISNTLRLLFAMVFITRNILPLRLGDLDQSALTLVIWHIPFSGSFSRFHVDSFSQTRELRIGLLFPTSFEDGGGGHALRTQSSKPGYVLYRVTNTDCWNNRATQHKLQYCSCRILVSTLECGRDDGIGTRAASAVTGQLQHGTTTT